MHNPNIFPDPLSLRPDRRLEGNTEALLNSFLPFPQALERVLDESKVSNHVSSSRSANKPGDSALLGWRLSKAWRLSYVSSICTGQLERTPMSVKDSSKKLPSALWNCRNVRILKTYCI